MEYTHEDIEKRFESLPEKLQDIIVSVNTAEIISNIGKKHQLHFDQVGKLAEEVGLVLMGFVRSKEFHERLVSSLGVSSDEANLITYDLNQDLFKKVRMELTETQTTYGQLEQTPPKAEEVKKVTTEKAFELFNLPKEEVEVVKKNEDNNSGGFETHTRDPYREEV